MAYWVQASPDGREKSTQEWQEILYLRLTGQFERIERKPSTQRAEEILGIGGQSYYYVGSTKREFGLICVAHQRNEDTDGSSTMVSPFDTGGYALGHLRPANTFTDSLKAAELRKHSYDVDSYHGWFSGWIDAAFDAFDAYVEGVPPTCNSVDCVDVELNSDARSWLWEGRIPAAPASPRTMSPVAGFAKPDRVDHYLRWTRRSRRIPTELIGKHIAFVRSLFRVSEDPIADMQTYLAQGGLNVGL